MLKSMGSMSLNFPRLNFPISDNLAVGIFIGYTLILSVALLLNKFGDLMFKKGFAKPFYIRGYRIHHRDILLFVLPLVYTVIVFLILVGAVVVVWNYFWDGIETISILAVVCLMVDLLFDKYSTKIKKVLAIPHEILYLSLPLYAFTHFLIILL
jgi:uncharacterized membrane protein YedE/YeeE